MGIYRVSGYPIWYKHLEADRIGFRVSDSLRPDPSSDADERARLQRAFGVVLRRLRDGRGMSQEDLAAESGVGRSFVAKLELGLNQPTLTTLFRLADGLGASAASLVEQVQKEAD